MSKKIVWMGGDVFVPKLGNGKSAKLENGKEYDSSDFPESFIKERGDLFVSPSKAKKSEDKSGGDE